MLWCEVMAVRVKKATARNVMAGNLEAFHLLHQGITLGKY
jgi:hypothetical protein